MFLQEVLLSVKQNYKNITGRYIPTVFLIPTMKSLASSKARLWKLENSSVQ